jgi:hypothetical protein
MQAIHELGHVLGAVLTGGRVKRVVLSPLTISRTDLSENPHPLFVAWAGPLFGAATPLLLWVAAFGAVKHSFARLRHFLQFFAGFCLLSNGLYISLGSFHHIGDSGDLLHFGSPIWNLWLFGAVTTPLGLFLWHKMGPRFGLAAT